MKLLTYKLQGDDRERLGVMCTRGYQKVLPLEQFGFSFRDMNELIEKITPGEMERLQNACAGEGVEGLNYKDIVRCAPIPHPKQDIICLGLNFQDHAEEFTRYGDIQDKEKDYAVYFSKRVNEATADGGVIPSYHGMADCLDYGAELGVIIGKDAFQVSREEAFDYVFGYTVLNDVSARKIQARHKQWYFGKSLDGFTPMGPFIVTENDVKRPPKLSIKSRVNGVLRQNSNTDLFIFDIPHVIEELSWGITLKAGTIISMGTPGGVGMALVPPRFLSKGDVVECSVEGIGMITNTVA